MLKAKIAAVAAVAMLAAGCAAHSRTETHHVPVAVPVAVAVPAPVAAPMPADHPPATTTTVKKVRE